MSDIFTTKFVKIIRTFNVEELKSFELWLNSPWANSNKALVLLLQKLKPYYPTFDHGKLTKEKLFKKILPNRKYSLSRINNLLSEGFHAAQEFIIFQNLKKDENLKQDLLTKELQDRYLEDWFFKTIDKEIDRLEAKEPKEWEDHLDLLKLNRRIYHHPNANTRGISGGQTISKISKQIELVFLLEQAATINEKIFRDRLIKGENHDITEALKIWKLAANDCDHLAIKLYQMRFDHFSENRKEQFLDMQSEFLNCYKKLNKKEQKIHLFSLMNDFAVLFRAGIINVEENLPLLKMGLEAEIFLNKGKLTKNRFVSIISTSNTAKDFEFTDFIIENHIKNLSTDLQTDAWFWAKAHTAYRKKDFNKSINFLLGNDFKDSYFVQASKILTTQVYFDLSLNDHTYQTYLLNYIDSYEKWLQREKSMSSKVKKSYLLFAQKARSLLKFFLSINFQQKKLETLFENETSIQALTWLKRKRDEIILLKTGGNPIDEPPPDNA